MTGPAIDPAPANENTPETTVDIPQLRPEQLPEQFFAKHIEPNTPYADEPSEMVPPGWYVVAADEPSEGPDIVIKVDGPVYDQNGTDITEALARKIAELLEDFADEA